MKHRTCKISLGLGLTAFSAIALSSCAAPKMLTVCLASEPASLDPALNSTVDGGTTILHLTSGLCRYASVDESTNKTQIEYDLADNITKEYTEVVDHVAVKKDGKIDHWEEERHPEGVRYTITLKKDLKWNNGDPLTSEDIMYSWNRASGSSLAADYAYLFETICDGVYHETDDKACPSLAMKKIDDTTFTVDYITELPYFTQLLAFPAFFPVHRKTIEKYDTVDHGAWARKPETYVGCGAYKMDQWVHDSYITVKANPYYWNAKAITLPQMRFALSEESTAMLASFNSGEYQLIDDVPAEQIPYLSKKPEYHVEKEMGTYYITFNINSTKWDAVCGSGVNGEANKMKVRKGLSLFINRKGIVDYVAQGGQTPANSFAPAGLSEPDGSQFVDHNGPNHDGAGYYDVGATTEAYQANIEEAIKLLREAGYNYNESTHKFTNFPRFTYLYNTASTHDNIAKNIRDTLAYYGIDVELKNEVWASFLEDRKQGNFDVARNGWVADYDDPSTFFTMWNTNSGNNDAQFGRNNHKDYAIYSADINRDGVKETGLTWAQSYDVLTALAAKEKDQPKRFEIMHETEDLLMETGAICPLYYNTDLFMLDTRVKGFYSSPLGFKFFMFVTKDN